MKADPARLKRSIVRVRTSSAGWMDKADQRHRETKKKFLKKWLIENPGKKKAYGHNRRAREMSAPGSFTAADLAVQRRAQTDRRGVLRCWWCSEPLGDDQTVDHRIPLAKGGSNNPDNLVLAHLHCNCSKGAKLPWEFNGRLI
jgi:hypothetical protein